MSASIVVEPAVGRAPARELVPDIHRLHRNLRWGVLGLVLLWMVGMGAFNLLWSYQLVEMQFSMHMRDQALALAAQLSRRLAAGEGVSSALPAIADWPDRMHEIDILTPAGEILASTYATAGENSRGGRRYDLRVPFESPDGQRELRLWMPVEHLHHSYGRVVLLNLVVIATGGLLLALLMGLTTGHASRGYEALLGQVEQLEVRNARARQLEAMGQMAAGVAHEVRNPLNAIGLGLQRIQDELLPKCPRDPAERWGRIVERLHDEVRRVNGVVEEFLALARPVRLSPERFDLGALLRHVVEVYAPEAQTAGVTLCATCAAGEHPITADRDQLTQAVLNLVRNGIEAAATSGTEARVELHVAKEEETYELRVIDNGPGASDGDLEAGFEAFRTTKAHGTGLGLTLVRRIADAHGGDARAHREGNLTVFTLQLPARCPVPLSV